MTKKHFCLAAVAVSGFILAATPSHAASAAVEDAKARCIIGEQADGYIGIVDDSAVDTQLRREVRDINQQRKALYADLAAQNGVPIDVTAALTAEKLINEAGAGECVRDGSGAWIEL